MPGTRKILMLTNSEHGQANVFLSVACALVQQDQATTIHIASFPRLSSFVKETSDFVVRTTPKAEPFHFHELPGTPFIECILHPDVDFLRQTASRNPTLGHLVQTLKGLSTVATPWNANQFLEIYKGVVRVIEDVDPAIVVVDNFFCPGLSACHHSKRNWLVLSPNSLKDFAAAQQPKLAGLWKYPRLGLIREFPIPWYQRPLNVLYGLSAAITLASNSRIKETKLLLKHETGKDPLLAMDLLMAPQEDLVILANSLPELDFPLKPVPNIIACGPILRSSPPVEKADMELSEWLAAGPTVYINLGTHFLTNEHLAVEMAKSIRMVFDTAVSKQQLPGLRILWKLKQPPDALYSTDQKSKVYQILSNEIEQDLIRIQSWITVEPEALLESGHIICSVNHGGASSFNEGVCAGIPQVILAQWLDTYDYAIRVEMLGTGFWGNKELPPQWRARELGPKIIEAILGPSADQLRKRAQEVAKLCRENAQGPGRDFAATFILNRLPGPTPGRQ